MQAWSDAKVYGVVIGAVAVLAVAATTWIYAAELPYYDGDPIRSDGVGYYVYLPAVLLDHDLELRRTASRSLGGDPAYIPGVRWVRTAVPAGYPGQTRPLNQYGIGEAVLLSPFFGAGHAVAAATGERRNGFSWPYQAAASAGGLVYVLLGLALVAASLRRWFSRRTVVVTLLGLTFGAAVFNYGTYETTLSHAYSFFLIALVVWLTVRLWERPRLPEALGLGAAIGLVGLVRMTNLTVVLFCLLVGIERLGDLRARARSLLRHAHLVAAGTAAFLLTIVWQFAYWHRIMATFLVDPYKGEGEHLELLNPHLLDVLFSVRKGLFFWTPLLLLAVAGLLVLHRFARPLVVACVAYLAVATWVVASWSVWWYGASFGMRALVDVLPVLAFGLAALVEAARSPAARRVVLVAVGVTTALAVHGLLAYWLKWIPYDETTFGQYLDSFGRWL